VLTAPEQRGQGLALQVVSAWASSVLRDGKIPFYSHAVENIASYKVAVKLGLVHLFDETVLEQV
jgi:predicted GNAT family acetyltransferase